MYWLLSIVIIIVMIAVLAVAGSIVLPDTLLSIDLASFSVLPYLLSISIILAFLMQRQSFFNFSSTSNQQSALKPRSFFNFSVHALYYLIIILLASTLVIFSGLQALNSHQGAERAKITQSMRVQALVTIEGISDSVYDPTIDSGYRQVAIISHLSPLVAEITAKNLSSKNIEQALTDSESYNNKDIENSLNNDIKPLQYKVLLSAYPNKSTKDTNLAAVNQLRLGDKLLMTLTVAPLATSQQALNNPTGFDSYRWLRGRHIDGVANILTVGEPLTNTSNVVLNNSLLTSSATNDSYFVRLRTRIDQGRWQLRQYFYTDWSSLTTAKQQANAVTLSLLTGDRSLINRETKDLYQLAGISHLLAISGTHVLFLAIVLAGLAVLIFDRLWPTLYRHLPRWQVRWIVMISAVFIYALFTGFDVPAARTAWMLLAIGAVRLTLLPVSTIRILLALAVLMAWVDPFVLWQAGYWLSFVAVALILKYDNGLKNQSQNKQPSTQKNGLIYASYNTIWPLFVRLFKLQCWLFIALLPITLLLFGKASLWGLVINLFAIGLFGWVIVPLNLLAGLCYLLIPSIANSLWAVVSTLVASLHELIIWLTALPALKNAWLYIPVNSAILIIVLLTLLPWLLPRGLISRWLALPPLALLIMSVYSNQQAFLLTPTIYVLPTNDRYLSAVVLQYPISSDELANDNKTMRKNSESVSWLFLADHRPNGESIRASSLSADKLAATLEQQLRTLSIKTLEGVVVQTSRTDSLNLTKNKVIDKKSAKNKNKQSIQAKVEPITVDLLSSTVIKLSQNLPIRQYWQAGVNEYFAANPVATNISKSKNVATISAQRCEQGKTWQLDNGELTLQALTGWSNIDDTSVWDCSIAIESATPIRVLQYNAANPLQSSALPMQLLANASITNLAELGDNSSSTKAEFGQSRLVLDASTHKRLWQLWSLLCNNDEPTNGTVMNTSNTANTFTAKNNKQYPTTWLSHSASAVATSVLEAQQVTSVITYDNQSLDAAFALATDVDISSNNPK